MKKGKNGKQNIRRSAEKPEADFSRTDYLAVLPGILMCLLTLFMLLMDVSLQGMDAAQYKGYPDMFRAVNCIIAAAGIAFFITEAIKQRNNGVSIRSAVRPVLHGDGSPGNMFRCISVAAFGLFIVLMLISTAVNGLNDKALHGVSFRNLGVPHLILLITVYMGLSGSIKSIAFRRTVMSSYLGVADLIAAAVLADRYISPIAAFGEKKDISAIFFNGNHYGYFLVMAVLLAAGSFLYSDDLRARIFSLISMVINLVVLAMNGSTGCMLAVAAVMLLTPLLTVLFKRSAIKTNLIMLSVLLAGFIVLSSTTGMLETLLSDTGAILSGSGDAASAGHNRWLLWEKTAGYIAKKPLLGYGCEGLSDILMETTGRANPHNEILAYAAQFGIPAAVCYTVAVLAAFVSFLIRKPDPEEKETASVLVPCFMAAAGYFISSLFGVTMFYTLPFFFIFLGLSYKN